MAERFTFAFLAYMVLSLRQMWCANWRLMTCGALLDSLVTCRKVTQNAPARISRARAESTSSTKLRQEIAKLGPQYGLPAPSHK